MSKIATKWIEDNAITADKIATSAVGNGLSGGGGTALAVEADATGGANLAKAINVSANGVAVKVDASTINENGSNQLYVPNGGITETQLNTSVAGNGITGGGGSALAVDPDATGGANLATVVNVSANGVAIKIDDSTIAENGSNQLYIPNGGVTETQLNSSVAGTGISGGGGSALAIDIVGLTAESSPDNADLIAIYDDSATAYRKQTRGEFLSGVAGESFVHEMHLITSGEVTAGYFTLASNPTTASKVSASVVGGPRQVNKQVVGATGATPDFDVLSTNQFHFNNNGAATGLSEEIAENDIVIIEYET